jgi:hypothetical protein
MSRMRVNICIYIDPVENYKLFKTTIFNVICCRINYWLEIMVEHLKANNVVAK